MSEDKITLVQVCYDGLLKIKDQIINMRNIDAVYIESIGNAFQVVFRFPNKTEIRHQFSSKEGCSEFIDQCFHSVKVDVMCLRNNPSGRIPCTLSPV